jgi:hypothetical protein
MLTEGAGTNQLLTAQLKMEGLNDSRYHVYSLCAGGAATALGVLIQFQ